jgi:phage gp29-like protein
VTFESVSDLSAQKEYDKAIKELIDAPTELSYNKAMNALVRLYPQWNQHELEHCLEQDLKEEKER